MPRILYIQYTNPAGYPPLEHSSRILADRGWQILFLGTGASGADMFELPPHPNIQVRKWKFRSAGLRQKLHYVAFNMWSVWTALSWRPKWIYASDLFSCPAGLVLNKLGFRVLYHEHDCPEGGYAEKLKTETLKVSSFQTTLLRTRRSLARCSDVCVIPNEKRLEDFKQATGRSGPTFCVWNCPLREEAEPEPQKASDKFIVFYHGSIVPSRLPIEAIDALAALPDHVVLEFAGYETVGHLDYIATLKAHAERLRVSDRFVYLGALSRGKLLPHTRAAHVGLAVVPVRGDEVNLGTMTGASNKPFDYMACGLALLISDVSDWRTMFADRGYGRVCNPQDPTSIAAALRWFIEHPAETAVIGEQGRDRILKDWNYEKQSAELIRKLTDE